jgi:energy-coupling factor transporter ATP-binding protein EcfA2
MSNYAPWSPKAQDPVAAEGAFVVDRTALLSAMIEQWKKYENTDSDRMVDAWDLLADTLDSRASGKADRAAVFAGPLGMGKTTLAQLYTAMMPHEAGALVIVRQIQQAIDFADAVNANGGKAFAYHSQLPERVWKETDMLVDWPVIVATHRTYEMGLNQAAFEQIDPRFAKLHAYRDGRKRSLVVIDEAMPQVLESRVKVEDIAELKARIADLVREHGRAIRHVLTGVEMLLHAEKFSRELSSEQIETWIEMSTVEADEALANLGYAIQANVPKSRTMLDTLTEVRALLEDARWVYVNRRAGTATATNARMLVPPARSVTLDATGALSPVHARRRDLFEIVEPKPTRSYHNVTVRVARTERGTGRDLVEHREFAPVVRGVLDSLRAHYGQGVGQRRVLFVTHKRGVERLREMADQAGFAQFWVGSWNALDGLNTFRSANTVVVLSHLYRDPLADANVLRAIDPTTPVTTNGRAVREARVAITNAQAWGRTQMRRMLTDDGACPPVDVWVRAPKGRAPMDIENVLRLVRRVMPDIQIGAWDLDERMAGDELRRTRGAKGDPRLMEIARGLRRVGRRVALPPGLFPELKRSPYFRMIQAATEPGNPLQLALAAIGCRVERGVAGSRGSSATLVKMTAGPLPGYQPSKYQEGMSRNVRRSRTSSSS